MHALHAHPLIRIFTVGAGWCFVALWTLGLGGCVGGAASAPYKQSVQMDVAHSAGTSLDVLTENGAIKVHKEEAGGVVISAEVHATTQEREDATRVTADRGPGGQLVVRVVWPDRRLPAEGCSFDISLPDAEGVMLHSSNGALSCSGLGGKAELVTSNGAIEVKGHRGPVHADTSNGAVRLRDIGTPVAASSSNGAIVVELADGAAGPVDIDTSNGKVEVVFPRSFQGEVKAKTSNGAVSLDVPDTGVFVTKLSRTSCVVKFGGIDSSAPSSTIDTSNGAISIKGR